ncbi:hypothetical protein ACQ4PT_055935 [Festuca glaucescens]
MAACRRNTRLRSETPPPFPHIVPVASKVCQEEQEAEEEGTEYVSSLPDDVLVEILSRLPYRSFCRVKWVSKPWLALCSDLDIHTKSPRSMSGFFSIGEVRDGLTFHDLAFGFGPQLVDPTLAFLGNYGRISVERCCIGGLLLCKCWVSRSEEYEYSYVVCNPTTENWTVLPPIENSDWVDGHCFMDADSLLGDHLSEVNGSEHFLGFDTANPSCFMVVVTELVYHGRVREVAIYSSETGGWTSMQSKWGSETIFAEGCEEAVFLNGRMHFTSLHSSIVTVDVEGEVWREIEVPKGHRFGSIGQSQGYLHYWDVEIDCQLFVWVLEDYGTGHWTLKHTVNVLELFGRHRRTDYKCYDIAFHPDCNLILITDEEIAVSYDMDSRTVQVIYTSKQLQYGLPYIPCFAKWPSDG